VVYMWNRWQDPETGRFISEDPAQAGENFYAYVDNNPELYIDPTGLDLTQGQVKEAELNNGNFGGTGAGGYGNGGSTGNGSGSKGEGNKSLIFNPPGYKVFGRWADGTPNIVQWVGIPKDPEPVSPTNPHVAAGDENPDNTTPSTTTTPTSYGSQGSSGRSGGGGNPYATYGTDDPVLNIAVGGGGGVRRGNEEEGGEADPLIARLRAERGRNPQTGLPEVNLRTDFFERDFRPPLNIRIDPLTILRPYGRLLGAPGSSNAIRILRGNMQDASFLFRVLTNGGSQVGANRYGGPIINVPGVGTFGLRPAGTSGANPTIDVNVDGLNLREIKFLP